MASFSIQDLLGLSSKECRTACENGKSSAEAAATDKDERSRRDSDAAREDDHEIDVETFEEDDAHQLVTVEVRTVRHASSVHRSSSRKRRRTEQAQERREITPESDDDHPRNGHHPSAGPNYSFNTGKDHYSKSSKRLRTAFTTAQLRALEYAFRMCPYPDSYGREQIARATGIDEAKIQVWFQNRRARYRKREKPMEPQKSPAGPRSTTSAPSPVSPHSMMQAFFTAAALSGAKLPPTTTPSAQPFYPPGNPFFASGFAAMPPYPPYFTYPTSPMAAAQVLAKYPTQTSPQQEAKDA